MPPGGGNDSADGDPGVVDDLEDQADWASYTQDIPRLGNRRREDIRLSRYRRGFRNLSRPSTFLRSEMWRIARFALGAAALIAAVAALVVLLSEQ